MAMGKPGKLDRLKMPGKRKDDEGLMAEMQAAEDAEQPGDEEAESPEYQAKEDEMGIEEHDDAGEGHGEAGASLEQASDDELMAELKKRGLMSKLEGGQGEENQDDSQSMYS